MSETTITPDSKLIWEQLERLFDWAGTRSTPMSPANLSALRGRVTEELARITDRADALEHVPLLREVTVNEEDGMRSVSIDMRDGTTRTFQTRVEWFDQAPRMPESSEALIDQLQTELEEQKLVAAAETARAERNIANVEEYERRIREATLRAERVEADLLDERQSGERQAELLAAATQRTVEADERIQAQEQRIHEITRRAERSEISLQETRETHEGHANQLASETERANLAEQRLSVVEAERAEWRERYFAEAKVVNDALPSLSKLLVQRTRALEKKK